MKEKIKSKKGFIQSSLLVIIVIGLFLSYGLGYLLNINKEINKAIGKADQLVNIEKNKLAQTALFNTTTTTTSGSLNTKNTVQEEKTITSGYDYSKLSNKYRNRALYVSCVSKTIRFHEYLDPILKDLEGFDEDKKITALLQFSSDSNLISFEQITLYRNNYQSNLKLKSSLIEMADIIAKDLKSFYTLETLKISGASGFLLKDKIFLTANHVNTGIISLSQQFQQIKNDSLVQYTNSPDFKWENFMDFLFDFQISCYVQSLNSLQKYPIKLPFTELGSDIAIGYLDQPIPTDNLQSFSLCKEPPKIGSSLYTPSYPGGEFLESFGTVLNKISQVKLTTGETITGDIYITDVDSIPGSSGGGIIVYTNNNDCLFGVNFAGDNKELFIGNAKSYSTSILPYIDKIKAIMQEK